MVAMGVESRDRTVCQNMSRERNEVCPQGLLQALNVIQRLQCQCLQCVRSETGQRRTVILSYSSWSSLLSADLSRRYRIRSQTPSPILAHQLHMLLSLLRVRKTSISPAVAHLSQGLGRHGLNLAPLANWSDALQC